MGRDHGEVRFGKLPKPSLLKGKTFKKPFNRSRGLRPLRMARWSCIKATKQRWTPTSKNGTLEPTFGSSCIKAIGPKYTASTSKDGTLELH